MSTVAGLDTRQRLLTAARELIEEGGYGSDFDLAVYFLHDVPPEIAAAGEPYQRPEADVAFG